MRFEGAIAVVERFSDKLNTVIEKLDKLESNKQQLEGYIEVEQESKHLVIHINMDDKS